MNFKEWLLLTEKIMIQNQEFRDSLFALQYIQKTHPNPQNLVVTFTEIDKVGINPKSKYKTPLGIYFYTLNYVVQMKMEVPFAGNQPYINVCEFANPNKIIHMTSDASNQKGLELLDVFPKEKINQATKKVEEKSSEYKILSNYSNFWFVTMHLANLNPTKWNAIFRECGIDGFVDHGTGTIHQNEKTQGVVFTASALKLLYSIPNYNTKSEPNYNTKYQTNKMTDEQIIKMLKYRRDLNVGDLIFQADNKEKIAELIVNNKTELSGDNVFNLLLSAKDKDQMAKILGSDNISKISDNNVLYLLYKVTDKDQMAKILGSDNISKISDYNVSNLLYKAADKDQMAKIIIQYKKELSDNNVQSLLLYVTEKDQMAKILGSDKISKLSYYYVSNLLNGAEDKKQMAQIIDKYHQNKTPEIQKEIDKYLS